jgi:hypothetical protein
MRSTLGGQYDVLMFGIVTAFTIMKTWREVTSTSIDEVPREILSIRTAGPCDC